MKTLAGQWGAIRLFEDEMGQHTAKFWYELKMWVHPANEYLNRDPVGWQVVVLVAGKARSYILSPTLRIGLVEFL